MLFTDHRVVGLSSYMGVTLGRSESFMLRCGASLDLVFPFRALVHTETGSDSGLPERNPRHQTSRQMLPFQPIPVDIDLGVMLRMVVHESVCSHLHTSSRRLLLQFVF